ncbi:hypothetical protein FRC11_001880, partial [Ceratobasidium sp. 423]
MHNYNYRYQLNDVAATPSAYNIDGATRPLVPPSLPHEPRQDFSNSFEYYKADAATYDTFSPTRYRAQYAKTANTAVQQHASSDPLFAPASELPRGVSITPSDILNIVEYVVSY